MILLVCIEFADIKSNHCASFHFGQTEFLLRVCTLLSELDQFAFDLGDIHIKVFHGRK